MHFFHINTKQAINLRCERDIGKIGGRDVGDDENTILIKFSKLIRDAV